jgi:hypothetical protein
VFFSYCNSEILYLLYVNKMLLVETEPIKASVRLILREPNKVSNFCKSWLYLKAMVENGDNIRIQLEIEWLQPLGI